MKAGLCWYVQAGPPTDFSESMPIEVSDSRPIQVRKTRPTQAREIRPIQVREVGLKQGHGYSLRVGGGGGGNHSLPHPLTYQVTSFNYLTGSELNVCRPFWASYWLMYGDR